MSKPYARDCHIHEFDTADALIGSGSPTEAIRDYDNILERCISSRKSMNAISVDRLIARIMHNKAVCLGKKNGLQSWWGKLIGASTDIDIFTDLIAMFADNADPELRKIVSKAMFNLAITLGKKGDRTKEIELYDIMIALYSHDPELQEETMRAMINKSYILRQGNDTAAIIRHCDVIIAHYGDQPDIPAQTAVINAMFNKATALDVQGDLTEEIKTYKAIIKRFENTEYGRDIIEKASLLKSGVELSSE